MQPSATRTALPFWLLIVIVGIIVGISMGRAQSMGLYLKPVTRRSTSAASRSAWRWRWHSC